MEKIAAVVVTYKRKELLMECLSGLVNQSRTLDIIYVVDNNSEDGTEELLLHFQEKYKERIEYIKLSTNTGGAGGFFEGVKRAYLDGYDWIWLMDDDVEPYPLGLERLLNYKEFGLCIHGQRMQPNGTIMKWGANFDANYVVARELKNKVFNQEGYLNVSVGCFEGMLIHREVIKNIGFPDRDYFITWDDTIYGYEASKWTNVLYVKELSLKRKRDVEVVELKNGGNAVFLSPFASYFHQRNRFLYAKKNNKISFRFWIGTLIEFGKIIAKSILMKKIRWEYLSRTVHGVRDGLIYIFRNEKY